MVEGGWTTPLVQHGFSPYAHTHTPCLLRYIRTCMMYNIHVYVYTNTQHNNKIVVIYALLFAISRCCSACCMPSFSKALNAFMGRTWFIRWFIDINMFTCVAGHSLCIICVLSISEFRYQFQFRAYQIVSE